jgi:predicted metal-dependent peptidase
MNHYIRHIIEAFDFNTVKKDNKSKNIVDTAMDAAIEYKLNDIVNDNILKFHKPTKEDSIWL